MNAQKRSLIHQMYGSIAHHEYNNYLFQQQMRQQSPANPSPLLSGMACVGELSQGLSPVILEQERKRERLRRFVRTSRIRRIRRFVRRLRLWMIHTHTHVPDAEPRNMLRWHQPCGLCVLHAKRQ
jgi:hypothetical protein